MPSLEYIYDSEVSSSEDDEEDYVPRPLSRQEISVEHQLDQVLKWMKDDKQPWDEIPEDAKRRLVGRTSHSSGPTALHILVDKDKDRLPEDSLLKPLVEYLVKSDRSLLFQVNESSGFTPLHWAIYRRNRSMVKWICGACDSIDEVLRIHGTNRKMNCIHLAIESAKSGTDKNARSLVEMASAATLAAQDEHGNTPLHLAVEYDRCRKGQINLIEAIIERSDYYIRLERPENDFNNNPEHNSPYMYHLASAEVAEKAEPVNATKTVTEATLSSKTGGKRPDQHFVGSTGHRANSVAPMSALTDRESFSGLGKSRSTMTPATTGLGPMAKANIKPSARDSSSKWERKPQSLSKALRLPLLPTEGGPQDDMQGEGSLESKKTQAVTGSGSQTNKAGFAREIRDFLKKHYLRSRGQDAALEILYGKNPASEKAISFDLSGYKSLSRSEIEQHISILSFETTLQYVNIPRISLPEQIAKPKSKNQRSQAAYQDGEGRTDVPIILQQLRQKGVETILEITIDDLEHPAHSDWAIEKALRFENSTRDMNVEAWNWKKIDVSPDLISAVASDVTSVQLYWSGANAVLRAWSESEGLPKLKKLRHIILHVQKGYLDTRQRIEGNIKAFRERLIAHIAHVRAVEVLEKLKLKESSSQRVAAVTVTEFSNQLQQEMINGIVNASGAKKKTPRHIEMLEKKRAMDQARISIKEFFLTEKRQEDPTSEAAKRRAKMCARDIADELAPHFFDIDIEVYYPGCSRRTYNNAGQPADGVLEEPQKHEWIQCMTEFRQLLYNAEKGYLRVDENKYSMTRAVEETGGPIQVALIDDGIEVAEIRLDESVSLTGRSFFPKPSELNSDKSVCYPWYLSSKGNGTVMASQIQRICPKADLCVLKLHDSYHPQSNKRQITMKSAAQAIREATRRKVHVISMSWAITPPTNETSSELEDIKEMESAIMEASQANILMFCSASDEGAKQVETFPSKALPGKIFKIGGADANGGLYDRVGDIAAVDFILPGQLVASEELSDAAINSKVQYWSGSSVATALAAGLAALILYCAQIRVARARSGMDRETAKKHFEVLRQYSKMKEAFNAIRTQGSTDKYLAVWNIFGKSVTKSRDVRASQQCEPIDLVAEVAKQLCYQF